MHQADTISHESAIVVLKSTDRLALTGGGVGPPSTFEDRTGDRTRRNAAVKADQEGRKGRTERWRLLRGYRLRRCSIRSYAEIRLMHRKR